MIFPVFDTKVWKIFHEKRGSAHSWGFGIQKQIQLLDNFVDKLLMTQKYLNTTTVIGYSLLWNWWLLKVPFDRYVQRLSTYVYSLCVSSSLSVLSSFSSMSSSSISGLSSVKTASSYVPSKTFEIPQVLKGFLSISAGISAHVALIQERIRFLLGAFFLPARVNSDGHNVIHAKYFGAHYL